MSAQHRIEIESHKDPDTLEREIEAKRRNISGIVDELEHKLSPGELFDRALTLVRGNSGEFMHNLGDTVKANPVPTLLTSIGLLWLMAGPRHRQHETYGSYGAESDIYGTDAGSHSPSLRERASSLKEGMSERMHSASQRVSDAGHRVGEMGSRIGEMGSRLSERSHEAARKMRYGARSARDGLSTMLVEQPLAVGAIGIAAGALLAAMLPPTRREDEWLGAASDRTRQRARELAESGLDAADEKLQSASARDPSMSSGRSSATGSSASGMGAGATSGKGFGGSGQTH